MINFPNTGLKMAGVDIIKLFVIAFQTLIDKGILTENELVGALARAGFTFTNQASLPASVKGIIRVRPVSEIGVCNR